jgi:four helix bundle protein
MREDLMMGNPILKQTFEFSLLIIAYCEKLEVRRKFVVANQLIRCGTSIGANCMEAQNAESKQDFIHKMKIAAKEAEETQYWLRLCNLSENYPPCKEELARILVICKLLGKIISTAKQRI